MDLLLSKEKTVEGRINHPEKQWRKLNVGDQVSFFSGSKTATFEVRGLVFADDFDELYDLCGSQLIPPVIFENIGVEKTANEIYEELLLPHNPDFETEMNEYGVIGIVILLIS